MAFEIHAQPLSREAFAKYGTYNNILEPGAWPVQGDDVGNVQFFRDMVVADIGQSHSPAFSNTRVKKRPLEIQFVEKHDRTCEGMLVIDHDCVMHLGFATPPGEFPKPQDLEVFLVPKGTFVCIRPGVWHDAPYVIEGQEANTLIMLPECTYVNDCVVYEYKDRPVIVL